MCDKTTTRILLFLSLMAAGWHTSAQTLDQQYGPKATKESSPYSRFGIGTLNHNTNALVRGIGGGATAYNDVFSVNSFNPATYSFLKATSIDFGFEASSNQVIMDNEVVTSGTATFSYLNLGIPLGKHLGMNLGFKPISHTYYNAADSTDVPGIGRSVFNYNGSGDLQFAYLGFSGNYKGVSIGFNAGYAFGSTNYSRSLVGLGSDSLSTSVRNIEFSDRNRIGGLYWQGGILYMKEVKKDHFLNVGATVIISQDLNIKQDHYVMSYQSKMSPDGMTATEIDTITSRLGKKGSLTLPMQYSFGLSYGKSFHWNVNADFQYADWSSFQLMGDREGVADNAYRMSLGGEITPNPEARNKSYFSMVTYRLGAYYGKDYLHINNTDITYVGGTLGASFPLKRNYNQFGRINTSLDIGQRGTTSNGLAREFYVRFTFGISLNDIWFIRPKYN